MAPEPQEPDDEGTIQLPADASTTSGHPRYLVPPASSSTSKPKARVRRRARKREGPPQLQFLTATDPSQFKGENAKRSVRSQAMIQYRYNAEQSKQKDKGKGKAKDDVAAQAVERAPRAEEPITAVTSSANPYVYQGGPTALIAQAADRQWEQEQQQHLYDPHFAAWGVDPDEGFGEPSWFPANSQPTQLPFHPSRYQRVQSIVPANLAARRVLDFDDCDEHEESQLRILIDNFKITDHIGDGVDPFVVIPQFASPELDSVFLVRKCNRAFVTQTTTLKWIPVLLSHPHMLLSATLTASTWLDMHAGCSGDSKRTVLVKGECIGWINERLSSPVQQYEDLTLIAILHLLAGEMWNCNEKTLHIHQGGIARLITHRGGMACLQSQVTAEVAAAMIFHCDIFCESIPIAPFYTYKPLQYAPIEPWAALPESPIFCPRTEFHSILRYRRCSEYTYELLSDMRDLTDLFIAHHAGLDIVVDLESEDNVMQVGRSLQDYERKVADIRTRLASMPSASLPGLPTTNDWLYESCRIASIIYAGSILMRVPFSVAAEPSRNPILASSMAMGTSLSGDYLFSTHLTESLYEALNKSDTTNIWGDMSGVLYWVSIVGAAAARTPVTVNMSHEPKSRGEARAIWIRRCLIMNATRPVLLLIFQHPVPVIMGQRKLLKVQELIGSNDSTRVLSRVRT